MGSFNFLTVDPFIRKMRSGNKVFCISWAGITSEFEKKRERENHRLRQRRSISQSKTGCYGLGREHFSF